MSNRYDWGIYSGINGIPWDRTEKDVNVTNQVLYMIDRSLLMFRYHGLPESIPAIELERILQTNGYAGITEVNGELYALYGGLGGMYDAYGRPTIMTVANPWLNFNATLEIGKDVVLMRNDTMMMGLIPIYSKYVTIMNENEITMVLASISKRVNNLISVSDDNTAESARVYLKKLEEGDLGYIFESKLFDSLKTSPMGSGGHVQLTELIELQQYLKASMYNEIGLNANFNMKRERLNTSEVEMNSDNLYPLVDNMLEHRRLALEEVNKKYGLNITVEFNSSWDYRVNQGEPINTKGLGMGDSQSQLQDEKPVGAEAQPEEESTQDNEENDELSKEDTLNPNGSMSSPEQSDDQEEDNTEPVEKGTDTQEDNTEEGEEETNDESSEVSADSTGDSSDEETDGDVSTKEDGTKDETDVARSEEVDEEDDTETDEQSDEEDDEEEDKEDDEEEKEDDKKK